MMNAALCVWAEILRFAQDDGDCFLENILLPRDLADPTRLTLIDPVSVAGAYEGHPLFDLVKYESYATGELLAMRAERVDVNGFDDPSQRRYVYRVMEDDPIIRPFRQVDWRSRFRTAYVDRYGEPDRPAYELLEGYFALVMALCTTGLHRQARVLRATLSLNAAL